ncbi:MAG: hypothetical protein ACIRZZ_07540 [Lactobacillus gallinarum]
MDYIKEISAYKTFCKKYFSKFCSVKFLDNKKAILHFFQMISFFEIITDSDDRVMKELAIASKKILMETLYAIPVGDKMFFSVCSRQLAEKILDIIYYNCVDSKITISNLSKMNYRTLWEDGIKTRGALALKIKKPKNKSEKYIKERIEEINSIFKTESDLIHVKRTNWNATQYLSQIVKNGTEYDEKDILNKENAFFRCIVDILPLIINLDIEKLTMSQRKQYLDIIRFLRKDALYIYRQER